MADRHPPSPALSNEEELRYGLHLIAHHNAGTQYQPEQYDNNTTGYPHSGTDTSYGSPASTQTIFDQFGKQHYTSAYNEPQGGHLGTGYERYGNQAYYQNGMYGYQTLPFPHQNQLSNDFLINKPPTPIASDGSGGRRRTRGSRLTGKNDSMRLSEDNSTEKSHASSTMKAKKASRRGQDDKNKIPRINAPLSVLTKDYDHIPIRNMEDWVKRPAEVRWKEVEKRKGYVTRPMNSFMLYRSAYAERTKIWCLQNNHQIVSSVSGESWPLEPPEVREQYNEYARLERENHQKAHPGYKFSPSKAQGVGRKRKGTSEERGEEVNGLDDADFDWTPSSKTQARSRQNKRQGREAGYPVNSSLPEHLDLRPLDLDPRHNRSSYQVSNPGKPLPAAIGNQDLYGQYYQTTVYPSANRQNVEDVKIRKTNTPSAQYGSTQPLVGLPGAHHYDLLEQRSQCDSLQPFADDQVDPVLLQYDEKYMEHPNGLVQEQPFGGFDQDGLFGTSTQMHEFNEGGVYPSIAEDWRFGGRTSHIDDVAEDNDWMENTLLGSGESSREPGHI